jgi:hypothetical protein
VYGGDPASARRRLPLAGQTHRPVRTLAQQVEAADVRRAWVQAPSWLQGRQALEGLSGIEELELELDDYDELLAEAAEEGEVEGWRIVRVVAHDVVQAEALWSHPARFDVEVRLSRDTAPWLASAPDDPRLSVRLPAHDRLTTSAAEDPDLAQLFARLPASIKVRDVPACISGRLPQPRPRVLDATVLAPTGKPEIFRFTRRFVLDHYRVKSLRCRGCVHVGDCPGLPVNFVRAHGFGLVTPIVDDP